MKIRNESENFSLSGQKSKSLVLDNLTIGFDEIYAIKMCYGRKIHTFFLFVPNNKKAVKIVIDRRPQLALKNNKMNCPSAARD